jgi:hypothetical protein
MVSMSTASVEDYKIVIICSSAKHATWKRKSKIWLAQRDYYNMFNLSDMTISGMLFDWVSVFGLTPTQQLWPEQVTFQWDNDEVRFVPDIHA